jgi:hypothetical protein
LKRKKDFYIAFYEQLALQGFQAIVDFSGEHQADICFKGNNIAHFTKTDHIIPNPNAEIPTGAIEQLQHIARETAAGFTACTEKPYDEIKQFEFSDGSYKLAEYNGMTLACGKHHLLGYVFYTFTFPNEIGQPGERETFFAKRDAARDFAVRSGLIDERQFFTTAELSAVYANAIKVRIMPGNDLSAQETETIDSIIEKVEFLVPELTDAAHTSHAKDFTHDIEVNHSMLTEYEEELEDGLEP